MGIHGAEQRPCGPTGPAAKEAAEVSCTEDELLSDRGGDRGLYTRLRTAKMGRNVGACGFVMACFAAVGVLALVLSALAAPGSERPLRKAAPAAPAAGGARGFEDEPCDYEERFACPAAALLSNPDMQWASVKHLMHTGNYIFGKVDFDTVTADVALGFKSIGAELQQHAPELAHQLRVLQINHLQAKAIVDTISALSVPEVQELGMSVAQVIGQLPSTAGAGGIRAAIEDSLAPHISEVQELNAGTVPEPVRKLWEGRGPAHEWELTLSPQNLHVMHIQRAYSRPKCEWGVLDNRSRSLVVFAGTLEVGRAALDLLKAHAVSGGSDWGSAPRDAIDRLHESIALPAGSNGDNCMEKMLWPLRCAAQGLDAMRVVNDWGAQTRGSDLPAQPHK